MMRLLLNVVALVFLMFMVSCGQTESLVDEPLADPTVTLDESVGYPDHLPAYPLPGERKGAGKADQFDNYKLTYPNIYGVTSAPKTPMRAPSEWEDSQALLIGWAGYGAQITADIIYHAKPVIDIYVIHDGQSSKQQLLSALSSHGVSSSGLKYIDIPVDSIWMRDYGPLSVRAPDGPISFIDPRYYHQRVYDDAIPTLIADSWGIRTYRQPLSWEGGTYITDGYGNCYYSQGVYWYGGTSTSKIHQYQNEYMGCETQIVMKPLENEGTTHSDMFAKLADKNHMVLGDYSGFQDWTNAGILDDNENILKAATLNDQSKLTVTRMPMPSNSGQSVWRTYINGLFVNGLNLYPTYTDKTTYQSQAAAIWNQVMPGWTHVAVDSTQLIPSGGAIHCITMKVPNGPLQTAETSKPTNICNGSFDCAPSNTQGNTCPLSYEGCCDGNTLNICKNGGKTTQSCGNAGCGWNDTLKAYSCGGSGAGPSNAPLSCGTTCTPNCNGVECGADGCGGQCGLCSDNEQCANGQCVYDDPCDGVSFEGCCDSKSLKYCNNSKTVTQNCESSCGWNPNGNNGSGWYQCGYSGEDNSGNNPKFCPGACLGSCDGKTCGNDGCGGSCGTCSSGLTCLNNQCVCEPNCSQKTCGDDGCGGICGTCEAGSSCESGQCVLTPTGCGNVTLSGKCEENLLTWCQNDELKQFNCEDIGMVCKAKEGSNPPDYNCYEPSPNCTPNCTNKECGPNGCGGVCGNCDQDESCDDGQCEVIAPQDPCDGISFEGCCEGDQLKWCEGSAIQDMNCDPGECGWDNGNKWYNCNTDGAAGPAEFPQQCGGNEPPICTPNCTDANCGDDGCGGICGTCETGQECISGLCVSSCNSDCSGKLCGDDGCGGSCGQCLQGEECIDGSCTVTNCQPKCDDKICGDDGCGASCGTCAPDESCDKFGQCMKVTPCIPDCINKQCGDDGCGGSCGTCGKSEFCDNGVCAPNDTSQCNGIPSTGMCEGNLLKWCTTSGSLGEINCAAQGLTCAMGNNGSYDCVGDSACVPSCGSKQCGADGCGDFCGVCPKDFDCTADGICVSSSCQPQCDGRQCGSDSCGGICGTCAGEQACNADNQCVEADCVGPNCPGETVAPATGDDSGCGCVVTGSQPTGMKTGGFVLALACLLLFVRIRKVRYKESKS